MSFSVRNCQTGLEYNGHNINTLFAQRRNIINPKFIGLIREILRFNQVCKQHFVQNDYPDGMTLGQFLADQGLVIILQYITFCQWGLRFGRAQLRKCSNLNLSSLFSFFIIMAY